jgi:hypothetical protein
MTNKVTQKKWGIGLEKSGNHTIHGIVFKEGCLKEHGEVGENNQRTVEKMGNKEKAQTLNLK